ncbi:MAG: 30S ribosomal protein S4e, partial [Candidatus Woesearchaeota archaeon]|nr:30S ribosomal protein S4e [Candidatus Woesearchaeota archaeon]
MTKNHLKRLNTPKTWDIVRKGITFITRPNPGAHSLEDGVSLNLLIRDMLGLAKNKREVRRILLENNVLVDGIRRKDHRFCTGFMDVIKFTELKEQYRVVIGVNGKLGAIKIDEKDSNVKLCKIVGKKLVGGKIQFNLFDGKNILAEKGDYKVGDTLAISVPKQEIKSCLKLEKGSLICLTGGSHIGEIGHVEDIISNRIKCKV